MSEKYNDDNVKKILQSEKIPERLEPENIKKMLDSGNYAEKRKKIRHKKILRIVSAAAAFAVVFSASVYFMKPALYEKGLFLSDDIVPMYSVESMKPAAKYSDVYNYFAAASKITELKNKIFNTFGGKKYSDDMEIAEEANIDAVYEDGVAGAENGFYAESDDSSFSGSMTNDAAEKNDYSDTYSQEAGVLEADIVKTDGNSIIYSKNDTLYVSQVDKGNFINSYTADVSDMLGLNSDGYIQDMYIYNGRLLVIYTGYENYSSDSNKICYGVESDANTYAAIFDTTDQLNLLGYYVQEGGYNDVRLMDDGYLYLITNDNIYIDYEDTSETDIDKYIPQYGVDDERCYVQPEDIIIPKCSIKEVYDYISYTNVSGLNLNSETPCQPVDAKSIAGYANTIYCSQQNLYVISGYDESEITRFAVSGGTITPQASGKVKGYVNDQFSMSEYNGYFRIAVTESTWEEYTDLAGEDSAVASNTMVSQKNSVYVLDMSMNIVGSIGDFGLNENIKSVNFNGDIAYVVTFRQTDPLYAIDLSNPAEPVMLDEFKISGYSSYMQKWSEGLLLGFGAEADENTGWETGIKLTMFDNSDPNNLQELDTVSITGYVNDNNIYETCISSEGIYERKALYIDPEKNLIGFPVEKWVWTNETEQCIYSYQFYSFENGKLVYRGAIEETKEGYDYEAFRRVVYIDGYFYAVSSDQFKSADAETFSQTSSVTF